MARRCQRSRRDSMAQAVQRCSTHVYAQVYAHVYAHVHAGLYTWRAKVLTTALSVDRTHVRCEFVATVSGSYSTRVGTYERGGLLGEYYDGLDLSGTPAHSRVDSELAFEWEPGAAGNILVIHLIF